jgi:hypothetical protein
MMPPDLFGRLRLLAEAYRLPALVVAGRVTEAAPAAAVRPVTAEVEARLPDGRFRVLVAGRNLDVALPAGTRPGDRVQIGLPEAAGGTAGAAGAEPPDTRLSVAGRFIAQLSTGRPSSAPPGSIPASQPVLPDAPVDTAVAAATLRELVALSGLFYESHQAEWLNNARETAQLRREPQGRLAPVESGGRAAAPAPAAPQSSREATDASEPLPAMPPVHPDAEPIIQQQLNALEAHHLVWNGQIWPGQAMTWEIEEDADRAPGTAGDDERGAVWRTRVALDLPRLGRIDARLALGPAGLGIRLAADSDATDALLGERLEELRAALAAAGMPAASLTRGSHGGR